MVRRKSQKTAEDEVLIAEAIDGIRTGRFKSPYEASKALSLKPRRLYNRISGTQSRVLACIS